MDSELQRSYQPNMLKANAVVIALVAIIATCLKLQEVGVVSVDARPRTTHGLLHLDEPQNSRSGNRPTGMGFNGGFIKKLRIIPDGPVVAKHTNIPVNYTFSADVEPDTSTNVAFASDEFDPTLELGNGDFGLPEVPLPSSNKVVSFPMPVESVQFAQPDRPLSIRRYKGPVLPWRARYVDWKVIVKFLIDESGHMQQMLVTHEQPANFGLAQALKNALYECYFETQVVNGHEVATQVIFTCEFSTKGESKLQTSGNIVVSMQ